MAQRRQKPKSKVYLSAPDKDGSTVEEIEIGHDEYYHESPKLIDDEDYRASRGICKIKGRIYNSAGGLQCELENRYDESGKYLQGRAVHEDGTVIER
jgi:hypothetical protein